MSELSGSFEVELWQAAVDLMISPPPAGDGLTALVGCVRKHLRADCSALYLLDCRTEELVLAAVAGDSARAEQRLRLGQGAAGLAAYQHHAIQSVHAGPPEGASSRAGDTVAVAIPVHAPDGLLGLVRVEFSGRRPYSVDEVAALERVVPRLVVLMVGAERTREALARRSHELQALNELGQAANAGLGLDETLELIAARALETLGALGAVVRLVVDDQSLALATMVAVDGFRIDSDAERRIAEYVAATGEPVLLDDVHGKEGSERAGASLVCVPLVLEERVVGTLSVLSREEPAGGRGPVGRHDDLDMLFALTGQVAAEIEDIRLTVRLQELVRTEKQQGEALRGLYSRSQALLQSISDGLIAVARDGIVEEVNAVAARILGADQAVLHGRAIDDLVEDQPPLGSWLRGGGQFSNRVVTLRSTAGPVAVMANLQPVLDGGRAAGAVLTFREMGEVRRLVNRMIGSRQTFTFADIIGSSPAIEKTRELARIAAGTGSNILIQGETGTGKEVVAQAIHNASSFSDGPFLAVNCAALPRDLIESELFGYVEGAFTGASRGGHLGKFELASGGTLFLDEIGEIPPDLQAKLLRVLQERAVVRVGGDRTIPVNCRVIAATNRDLAEAETQRRFRRDLLYRLNVITIEVPPLRNRTEDLPLFLAHFTKMCAQRNGKVIDGLTSAAQQLLSAYSWPGNVRELENVVEHGVAVAKGRLIDVDDLPESVRSGRGRRPDGHPAPSTFERARQNHEEATRDLYCAALEARKGNVPGAAQLLGVSRATMYRRLKQHKVGLPVAGVRRSSRA